MNSELKEQNYQVEGINLEQIFSKEFIELNNNNNNKDIIATIQKIKDYINDYKEIQKSFKIRGNFNQKIGRELQKIEKQYYSYLKNELEIKKSEKNDIMNKINNNENINSLERGIKDYNQKLKEIEKIITELEEKTKNMEEMSKENKINDSCIKEKENKINEQTIKNDLDELFESLIKNSLSLKTKIIDEYNNLSEKLFKNNKKAPNEQLKSIKNNLQKSRSAYFKKENKYFSQFFHKIDEIKRKIEHNLSNEAINFLFQKFPENSFKLLCISYSYQDGKKKNCRLEDMFENFTFGDIDSSSGNIFLNPNYYNNNSKIIFFQKENRKLNRYNDVKYERYNDVKYEINSKKFYKIDELNINKAIEKTLDEIKNYNYCDDVPNLQFGAGQNLKNEKEFLKMLNEYYAIINNNLKVIFEAFNEDKKNKNTEGIKKIVGNMKEIIDKLHNKEEELNSHFKVEFSNSNYKCRGTQKKIDALKIKISQLNAYISKLMNLINDNDLIPKFSQLKGIKEGYEFFNKTLKLFLPKDNQAKEISQIDFSGINENSDLLKLPIISIVNNAVTCSYPNLKLKFGPYIASLYQEPIRINFTSLIKDLSMNISKVDEKYKNLLKCDVDNANGIAQLEIRIPKMAQAEKDKEVIIIRCQIDFNSPGFKKCLFDCDFTIEIIPLQIIAYCDKFKLAKIDNEHYKLCETKVISGSPIKLFFKKYNINKKLEFTYKIESLEKNNSDKPEIIEKEDHLELILGKKDVQEAKRLNCQLFINFYDKFNMIINIDCYLIPFIFKFEVYDYISKSYKEAIDIYIKVHNDSRTIIRPNKIPLHFRVIFPDYNFEGKVEFSTSKCNFIVIENYQNIPKDFNKNFIFDLDLLLKDNIIIMNNGYKKLKEKNFVLELKLNDRSCKININIEILDKLILKEKYIEKYINKFIIEKCLFINDKEEWNKEKINNNKIDLNATYVSIYGLEHLFYLDYEKSTMDNHKEKKLYVSSSKNTFLIIEFKYEIGFIFLGRCKIDIKYISNDSYYYDYNEESEKFGIMGYIGNSTDLWYPCFYIYEDFISDLQKKYQKFRDYKDFLQKIVDNYYKNIPGDFTFFAYKLAYICIKSNSESRIKIMKDLFEKIKTSFKKDISNEISNKLDIITKNNDDSVYKAFYDIISLLYKTFKERYEFIKSLGFTITLSSLDKEKINKKSDELLKQYFSYDESKSLGNINYIYDSFKINADIEEAKKMFKELPESQKIAIIFKEENIKENGKFSFKSLLHDKISTNYPSLKTSLYIIEDSSNIYNFKTEKIDDFLYEKEWSLFSLKNFFIKCIKYARELPLFAINSKLENNEDSRHKTESLYIKLLSIYEKTSEKDDSFIGGLVMTFNDQFQKMTNNLLNSNIVFKDGILPKKFKLNKIGFNKQYIIHPKEINSNILNEKQWESKCVNNNKEIKTNFDSIQLFKANLYISNENISGNNRDLLELKEKMKREEEKKEKEKQKFIEKQKLLKSEQSKIFEEEKQEETKPIIKEKPLKKEDLISNFKIKIKTNKRKSLKIEALNLTKNNSNNTNNDNNGLEINIDTTIKKENIKIDLSNFCFNDEILLRLVLDRMREIEDKIKEGKTLPELGIKKNLKGQPDYRNEKPSINVFDEVKEIYQRGMTLAYKIIKKMSEKKIPFSNISVNLLIDCSGFINIEDKLKQFLIICGIAYALYIVNIQYAISIVGDSQFQCTLKPFDLDHSIEHLQKVFDCLFINRFIGKNANFIKYALNCTNAKTYYRTILIFSNGFDEDFLLTDSWNKNVFQNNINYSFGFFFIISETLFNNHLEDLKYIIDKWKNFKDTIKNSGINIDIKYYNNSFEDLEIKINGHSRISYEPNKLYDEFAEMITNLLERQIDEKKIPNKEDSVFKPAVFDLSHEEKLTLDDNNINLFEEALKESYENKSDIYLKKTHVLKNITNKVCKLDLNIYKNQLSKIIKYDLKDEKIKSKIHSYTKKFIENRTKLNKAKIEAIFKPNKPSQKVLSTTGTEFDIPALIMNLINPSCEPMIYLEEKGGMKRNYSVTLIIDTSYSCFNPLCMSFSLQSLRIILSTLTYIDLPCFDFILSRQENPEILCSNLSSVRALNSKSILWESLISLLAHPCSKSDLASAIEAAFDLKRMRTSEYTSYLFILTDGLYQENEHKRILRAVSNCVKSGLNVFGIGIGIYPILIEKLFPKIIYCHNPYNLNKAIANFFGESISGVKDSMNFMDREEKDHLKLLNKRIKEIIENYTNKNKNYQSLYNKLNEVIVETDAFLLISNKEDDYEDLENQVKSNPVGEGKELLKRDQLKGHKILIVMLWSINLNPDKENECIHKDYLTKVSPESEACLQDALDFLGLTIEIVENYRDAITKLTSKTENGKCPYYACWIINGEPYDYLPDGSKEGFLFGQFLDVLKLFWEAGGALVFLAEGSKLQYQTNEFLKIIDGFDGNKINFRLVAGTKEHPDHRGGKNLMGDKTGKLEKIQQFSKKIEKYGIVQRLALDHNLFILFEGDTICYTDTDDYQKLLPFHPFSRDSDNGISSLFYLSDDKKRGDIFIDCGFTKLFIKMKKDDTAFRYFQNIASWSARPEIHLFYDRIDIKDWRPEGINYIIDPNKKWIKFEERPIKEYDLKSLKTLFAFDNSRSVSNNTLYFEKINELIKEYYKDGDKLYLWDHNKTELSKTQIDMWIESKKGNGGTISSEIAEIAKECESFREHLIIVTDGHVNEKEIENCDKKMEEYNIQFKFVSVYVIGPDGNKTVGAPFCRGCPSITYHVISQNEIIKETSLTLSQIDSFKSIPIINTIEEFDKKYDDLISAIKAKQLGRKKDENLMNDLAALKERIINSISEPKKTEFENKWQKLYEMAQDGVHKYEIGTAGIKK